jgi:hypothetical protein
LKYFDWPVLAEEPDFVLLGTVLGLPALTGWVLLHAAVARVAAANATMSAVPRIGIGYHLFHLWLARLAELVGPDQPG